MQKSSIKKLISDYMTLKQTFLYDRVPGKFKKYYSICGRVFLYQPQKQSSEKLWEFYLRMKVLIIQAMELKLKKKGT